MGRVFSTYCTSVKPLLYLKGCRLAVLQVTGGHMAGGCQQQHCHSLPQSPAAAPPAPSPCCLVTLVEKGMWQRDTGLWLINHNPMLLGCIPLTIGIVVLGDFGLAVPLPINSCTGITQVMQR